MSAPELDEVEALLERVLPDPLGFAERLLQQVVTRWAELAPPITTVDSDSALDLDPDFDVVETPNDNETLADSNVILATALGACDCWGLKLDCVACGGDGSAGWMQPDVDLFNEYVHPAVNKLTSENTRSDREVRVTNSDPRHDVSEQREQGEK